MAKCDGCGKEIERVAGGAGVNPGASGKVYHMGCAPDTLVRDALTEWDAIVAKGVKYFVEKYLPGEARPPDYASLGAAGLGDSSAGYSTLFTETGQALRAESQKRGLKS